ncbi:mitochondrial import inner membrane translocase subunit Tim23-like protein [Dinothrombium tinctorium]|uniref:Mitochondrial import inner membrane translocase subunit Tim23-like protein n=1 Tax=Dinothrombium tinctorium TaxID=1965070 RepID=A0A3S3NYB5_9ACAR|nr:mitochondrial import inner membrane translocase subunit Tim23-like protein [Dinothrombium tinctorium]
MDQRSDIGSMPPPPPMYSFGAVSGISSPYLNFDPNLITPNYNASEYIFPDGGPNRHSRGRFELAFSQIGASVMTGAALGGIRGGINGYKNTLPSLMQQSTVEPLSWSVRRSQILNYITKTGANTANAFGIVALLYSGIGVGLGFINDSNDDLNTITAATATGLLYRGLGTPKLKSAETATILKSVPSWQLRLRRGVIGGIIGLTASTVFVLLTNSEKYLK